ncbi:hypothetical protein HRK05_05590 [Bordetella pertussis]|nr:hypothetical protein HRK05_05590 [Bordetella pertussis]
MYRLAVFFLPPGRPKAKKPPWGAASPHSGRSVGPFAAGPPQGKKPFGAASPHSGRSVGAFCLFEECVAGIASRHPQWADVALPGDIQAEVLPRAPLPVHGAPAARYPGLFDVPD